MHEAQTQILDALLDDQYALWDFADALPALRPESPGSKLDLLIDLVQRGYVDVTFGRWFENETTRVHEEEAIAALRNSAAWRQTGREPGYVLEITAAGVAHLRERGIELSHD